MGLDLVGFWFIDDRTSQGLAGLRWLGGWDTLYVHGDGIGMARESEHLIPGFLVVLVMTRMGYDGMAWAWK